MICRLSSIRSCKNRIDFSTAENQKRKTACTGVRCSGHRVSFDLHDWSHEEDDTQQLTDDIKLADRTHRLRHRLQSLGIISSLRFGHNMSLNRIPFHSYSTTTSKDIWKRVESWPDGRLVSTLLYRVTRQASSCQPQAADPILTPTAVA